MMALLSSSCSSPPIGPQSERIADVNVTELTEEQAGQLVSRIREGMTFEQVAKIIPLSARHENLTVEHGGVWYDVPLGAHRIVQLRFERPLRGQKISGCVLNYPPQIKRSDN
jgi:hypothetical protein